MPSTCCCVPGCCNRGGFRFPSGVKLRKDWIVAIKRCHNDDPGKLWEPSDHSVVCRAHFSESDFISITAYDYAYIMLSPSVCLMTTPPFMAFHGSQPLRRQRKSDAVPSIFPWSKSEKQESSQRLSRLRSRNHRKRKFCHSTTVYDNSVCEKDYDIPFDTEVTIENETEDPNNNNMVIIPEEKILKDSCCQTQDTGAPTFSIDNIKHNDAAVLFYTGLACYQDFKFVLFSLGEAAYHLVYWYKPVSNISIENQLLLTLTKLRQHKTNFELALMFGISETTVTNIWVTWINFMHLQWSEIECWPDRDLVRFFSPADFRLKFPSTRVVIDGTECPIKKPHTPIAQQATYSTYKNRNTLKVLVGSTPGGLVSYLSPAYGGSASDRQLVERGALTVLCDPGDSIMADKGFNVQDLFATKDVTINMPTFFSQRNRMSNKTVMRDRKISSKRVHIERIIGLAKTFKILTSPLNSSETKLATEIISVCFKLCMFKKCIIPKTC